MRKRYSERQIVYTLKQTESVEKVSGGCRKMGVVKATFYNRKKRHISMGVSELRRMKELKEEKRRLKSLVAEREKQAVAAKLQDPYFEAPSSAFAIAASHADTTGTDA